MKIFDAILEGCKDTHQAFGQYETSDGKTCGLGAAIQGAGITDLNMNIAMDLERRHFPELNRESVCPVKGCDYLGTFHGSFYVIHLNDDHHYKREWIAWHLRDILEPVPEAKQEVSA